MKIVEIYWPIYEKIEPKNHQIRSFAHYLRSCQFSKVGSWNGKSVITSIRVWIRTFFVSVMIRFTSVDAICY